MSRLVLEIEVPDFNVDGAQEAADEFLDGDVLAIVTEEWMREISCDHAYTRALATDVFELLAAVERLTAERDRLAEALREIAGLRPVTEAAYDIAREALAGLAGRDDTESKNAPRS